MKNLRANSSQRGFTLIELLIAMLIGVFLMVGVIQIFLSAKQAYRLQENLSRLQENGRFAMDMITKDIRMAGFMGCSSKLPVAKITNLGILGTGNTNPNPATIPAILTGIFGSEVTSSSWNTIACGAANECTIGTDSISFQSATSCGGQLTTAMASTAADPQISATNNTCGIVQYDVLLIGNCTNADFFVASSVSTSGANQTIQHATPHNNPITLSARYDIDAEIFDPRLVSYYIRTSIGGGARSLWVVDNTKKVIASTNPAELAEGIENMQILYGIDTDATPDYVANYYVPAPTNSNTWTTNALATPPITPNWKQVVSVRINLLAVTIDNNLTDTPQPYTFNGTTITPPNVCSNNGVITAIAPIGSTTAPTCSSPSISTPDLRIRRVFSSTIAVRNRLL